MPSISLLEGLPYTKLTRSWSSKNNFPHIQCIFATVTSNWKEFILNRNWCQWEVAPLRPSLTEPKPCSIRVKPSFLFSAQASSALLLFHILLFCQLNSITESKNLSAYTLGMLTNTMKQGKAAQSRAELSSRPEGTASQASHGKSSKSYTRYLMQHTQPRNNDCMNLFICCLHSLASN